MLSLQLFLLRNVRIQVAALPLCEYNGLTNLRDSLLVRLHAPEQSNEQAFDFFRRPRLFRVRHRSEVPFHRRSHAQAPLGHLVTLIENDMPPPNVGEALNGSTRTSVNQNGLAYEFEKVKEKLLKVKLVHDCCFAGCQPRAT